LNQKTTQFSALAFDLDGTLYPNYRFYMRLIPFLLNEQRYLRAFGKARDRLRAETEHQEAGHQDALKEAGQYSGTLYQRQARYMAEILKKDPVFLEKRTEKIIYRGWEPLFNKIKLFPFVKQTLNTLRENGIKLGLLSDFPPETKIDNLGLSGYWDTVLCSETIGRLKPDPLPFQELCRAMAFPPEKILYVGNSFSYDVLGAQRAGMKAAWVIPKRKYHQAGAGKADFVFYDYRQLSAFVVT
jgi:putative hydrolase of the HAD superfamily